MATLDGVLFDIDGTLLLSNDAHAHAWVDAFAEHGYDVPFDQIRPLIGMGGDKLLATVAPGLNEEEGVGKQVTERRREIFLERYMGQLKPAPGGRELVKRVKEADLKLGVATSAKSQELEALLKAAHVDDLFDKVTTSSDVGESKPAPDVVNAALDDLKLPAEHVLLVGDTPYDIESGTRCYVGVIAVRCGGWDDEHLKGAIAIYDDPADIAAHYEGSPLGERQALPAAP
jgi:HAD superfamily hydrolase (TIGR01549 family)